MLTVTELLALSVSGIEAELESGEYTAEVLTEALEAEAAGSNRKTAIEALTDAMPEEAEAEAEAEAGGRAAGVYVGEGKAITTKAGLKGPGQLVKAKHLAGGENALAALVAGGHCVEVK